MAGRKSKEELNKIMEKYNVRELWSWSKYNYYKNDKFGYLLKYILKTPPDRHNTRYGVSGNHCHNIIESAYSKEIEFEQMLEIFEEKLFEMDLAGLKYDRKDDGMNEKIAKTYEDNLKLFFKNHIQIPYKMKLEQFVAIKVGDNVLQGYIDFLYKNPETEKYVILDWKSSSIYTGAKAIKERGQLLLYTEALHQLGIPYENISAAWNFLKYCTVEMDTAKKDTKTKQYIKNPKTTNCLRNEWVNKIHKNIIKWLKVMEYDEIEIDSMIAEAISNNNLDNMPKEIQECFRIKDCYVYIDFTEEDINELKNDIKATIEDIKEKTEEYNRTGDDSIFWTEIDKTNEYYFHNLSDYGRTSHKPYNAYLEDMEMFIKDEYKDNDGVLEEDDWMKDL